VKCLFYGNLFFAKGIWKGSKRRKIDMVMLNTSPGHSPEYENAKRHVELLRDEYAYLLSEYANCSCFPDEVMQIYGELLF